MGKIILVTGASRSGKSEWAEYLACQSGQPVTYVATATETPDDAEWTARIQRHRDRRPEDWQFIAESHDLTAALQGITAGNCVLVDSLGLWVASHLETTPTIWQMLSDELLQLLPKLDLTIILVAEETGWGIVPAYELGRLFRDRLGSLTRQIGAIADTPYLVVGGYALNLKKYGEILPTQ
jgi:adenosylcobinamide kinase/adenosylcobinamide-phosphate guanylyltransferase